MNPRDPLSPALSLEAFEDLLDRHGSDLARFPDAVRDAARRLVESDPRAAALLTAEASTIELLSTLGDDDPPPALLRRVFEIPARAEAPKRRGLHSVFGGAWAETWKAAFASTLLLALGALTGWASDATTAGDASIATASDAVEGSASGESNRGEEDSDGSSDVAEEWETWSELAFADELSEDF